MPNIYEDEESVAFKKPQSFSDFMIKYGTYLILVLGWFILRGKGEIITVGTQVTNYTTWDFWFLMALIGLTLGKTGWAAMKLASPYLISNPIKTTTVGYPVKKGIYALFTMGDLKAWTFDIRGHEGTIIVPRTAVTQRGRNIDISCRVEPIKPEELPYMFRNEILSEGWKEPFYRGYVGESLIREPEIQYLITENKELNKTLVMKDRFLKSARVDTVDAVTQAGVITARKESFWNKIKPKRQADEEV
jgi:hypothetical protein